MSEAEEFRQAVGGFLRAITGFKGHLLWLRLTVWATLAGAAGFFLAAVLWRLLAR